MRNRINIHRKVATAQDYYPYGEILRSYTTVADVNSKYRFTEKERDTETNYDYFGARYYDSELIRWLNIDPLADLRQGLSPYNYCQNNPIVRIDPTGMLDENWVTSTIAGVQGRMRHSNIIDGTTVTVNGDDNKKKEQKDKGTSNSSLVSPGLATLGISLDGIFRNLDDQFWLIVKELGYDRKSLTVIGGLGETAKIMGYSTFVLGVIVDYNRFQDGEISQSQLISNLSISLGILVSPVYGIPTYLWYQSLPQYFIQQQQALDAQEKMNYPVLPKFGF